MVHAVDSPSPLPLAEGDPARRFRRIAALALTLLFSYYFVYHLHRQTKDAGGHLGDFRTFYMAGQFARQHRDIYQAGPNSSQMYVYPPLIAFLCAPLTLLPLFEAAKVWLALNTLILLASVLIASRAMLDRLDASRAGAVVITACLTSLLSENELRAVLTMLETDPMMLLMFALALWWLDRRPAWAGLSLAFAFNIKYLSIVALPYLIVRRRWQAAAGMVLGSALFALLPAMMLGWREDLRCLRVSMGGLLLWVGISPQASHSIRIHNIADDLSVSITSTLARIMGPHGFSNTKIMALAALAGGAALALVAAMYRSHRFRFWSWPAKDEQKTQPFKGLVAVEWAGLVAVALCFSPDTNTRHLVLAVIVNALAASLLLAPGPAANRGSALAGALVIVVTFIMPFGTRGSAAHWFYFNYGIPCWGLLIGYLLILRAGLGRIADRTSHVPMSNGVSKR